ncbi:hypothetical protein H8965_000443 [Listeria monocytogenes]|uniref:VanZ family protein n=1 Tax=Listeria welshimeri TaxID=1643 RepID=UPI001888DEBF|nr:VanZ family protein [Listeria welshimeri]EEO3824308.1 hypothetical protein [Listeria monocytogenes]EGC3652960.1 hypothetical protein [Listeria monocytogenes]MBF2504902.1 hypothetical protein [Listeria welshimeri]MBF2601315.1 hypothetical protein [Listeria welshimeri]
MFKENMFSSKKVFSRIILFFISLVISTVAFIKFFYNILPVYFGNMESLDKNILAFVIILLTLYILLKMTFRVHNKWDGYILFFLYVFVLVLGLLRPDGAIELESFVNLNPMQLVYDLQENSVSWLILFINFVMFMPMYFLMMFIPFLNTFFKRLIFFEILILILEGMQAILQVGMFDIADIMLYNAGFFVGVAIVTIIKKFYK